MSNFFFRRHILITVMMVLLALLALLFIRSRVRQPINNHTMGERDHSLVATASERSRGLGMGRRIPINDLPGGFYYGDHGHWSPPLNDAEWLPASSATHMKPKDPVAGFYFGKRAWALPWWILKNYHVANIELGGRPVLVTFCEYCSSATAYDPVLNGKKYEFRIVGLYNGSHIVSDFQTDSLWGPFTGESIAGKLKGERLKRLRLDQCLWTEWLEAHPNTMVLAASENLRSGHGSKYFPGKAQRSNENFMRLLIQPLDKRLDSDELILGVWVEDKTRAYPIRVLDRVGSILNDTLGSQEIVIIHRVGTLMATAFSRRLSDEVLVFDTDQNGRIIDQKYGSHWNDNGEAYDGPLTDQALSFVHSGVEEWYIWAAYHPETDIFQKQD